MAEVAAQALIGPRKYIQGRGVLGSLGEHVNDLGKTEFEQAASAPLTIKTLGRLLL